MALGTTPRTWVAGEIVTDTELNTEIRDNLNSLNTTGYGGTPTSTTSAGTGSASSTESRDAVLGNYSFTAVAGRRYLAVVNGIRLNGTVANDVVACRIRYNSGSSTPTSSSTLCADNQFPLPTTGSTGATSMPLQGTFVPGAGVQTLAMFIVRTFGTGLVTPSATAAGAARELFVIDLGPA